MTYPRHCLISKVFISGRIRKQLLAHALRIVRCMKNLEDKTVRTISGVPLTLLPSPAPDSTSCRLSCYYILLNEYHRHTRCCSYAISIDFDYCFLLGKFNEIEKYRRHNMGTQRFLQ